MFKPFAFSIGVFLAGVVTGTWWLILVGGGIALCLRFSYTLIFAGVILDLFFLVVGESIVPFFYTGVFLAWALVCEWVRSYIVTH